MHEAVIWYHVPGAGMLSSRSILQGVLHPSCSALIMSKQANLPSIAPLCTCEGLSCCSCQHLVVMQLDAHILQLLTTDACWPAKKSDAYSSILDHGADALDVLAAAACSKALSGLYVGIAYRASTAVLLLQAHIAGENLQQLLSTGPGNTAAPTDSAEISLEAVSTADVAGTAAGEQQLNPGVSCQEGPEDPVLEVALQLVSSKQHFGSTLST